MRVPVLLVVPLLVTGTTACQSMRPQQRRSAAAADSFRPPGLELPRLSAPAPLPATRVLHLFYTSNTVADLEPCG